MAKKQTKSKPKRRPAGTQPDTWRPFRNRPDLKSKHPDLIAVYENGEYLVQVWPVGDDCGVDTRIAIKRIDNKPIHNWRDFQRIKNEILDPERTAVEVYPPESELTDTANLYHLWVFPLGYQLRFGLGPPTPGNPSV